MKSFTICFMVTGGISVKAKTMEEAVAYFESDAGQEEVGMALAASDVTVTEIIEDDVEDDW